MNAYTAMFQKEVTELQKKIMSNQYGAKMNPSEYQDHFQKRVNELNELQKETMQNIQNKNSAPTQPIRLALNLLDQRINKLQDVCDRFFTALQPITSKSDETYPIEKIAREGNSDLNCSLNKMADRLEEITVALQLQTDRLEV